MTMNQEDIRKLGKTILDADKDEFGLKTDGNGNVVLTKRHRFMDQVLQTPHKYIALADRNHYSYEMLFDNHNARSLRKAGVNLIFNEGFSEESLKSYQDAYREKRRAFRRKPEILQKHFDPAEYDVYTEVSNFGYLTKHGIETRLSDTRQNKGEVITEYLEYMEVLKRYSKIGDLTNILLHESTKWADDDPAFHDRVKELIDAHYLISEPVKPMPTKRKDPYYFGEARLSEKELTNLKTVTALLKCSNSILEETHRASSGVAEQIHAAKVISSIAAMMEGETPLIRLYPPDAFALMQAAIPPKTSQDVIRGLLALNERVLSEQIINDPLIATKILSESHHEKKVLLRWGAGHFDSLSPQQDLDEYLGKENTLIIATVADKLELKNMLANLIFADESEQLPHYLYMPAHKDEHGRSVPEQAISVSEYITSEYARMEAISEQPSPQKGRE